MTVYFPFAIYLLLNQVRVFEFRRHVQHCLLRRSHSDALWGARKLDWAGVLTLYQGLLLPICVQGSTSFHEGKLHFVF